MDELLILFSKNKDALTAIGIILTFLTSSISLYFSVRNIMSMLLPKIELSGYTNSENIYQI